VFSQTGFLSLIKYHIGPNRHTQWEWDPKPRYPFGTRTKDNKLHYAILLTIVAVKHNTMETTKNSVFVVVELSRLSTDTVVFYST